MQTMLDNLDHMAHVGKFFSDLAHAYFTRILTEDEAFAESESTKIMLEMMRVGPVITRVAYDCAANPGLADILKADEQVIERTKEWQKVYEKFAYGASGVN